MVEGMLVNFVFKGFRNRTTTDVNTVVKTFVTFINEAMTITTTRLTIFNAFGIGINVVVLSPGEGKRM
jgi:hypothetical protein